MFGILKKLIPEKKPNPTLVCPICLKTYCDHEINPEWSTCPDCGSEAMEIDVMPIPKFLEEQTIENLKNMLEDWQKVSGYRKEYKKLKEDRIRKFIKMKETTQQSN